MSVLDEMMDLLLKEFMVKKMKLFNRRRYAKLQRPKTPTKCLNEENSVCAAAIPPQNP